MNTFVASNSLCLNALPFREAKHHADDAWKAAGNGKDKDAVKKVAFVEEE